jgi:RNA polymerase sigma-70 factor (ECF subfamily)
MSSDVSAANDDRQLVDAVLAGDGEAFRFLVERESRPLLAVCRRILRDPMEAEDAAQEALLQAYRALGTYRGDGSFGAWLARIGVRIATVRLVERRAVMQLLGPDCDQATLQFSTEGDPEGSAVDAERRRAIRDAIAALPVDQRRVVALRFLGELSIQEIANITQRPAGTVKSRLHRGIDALREHLTTRAMR